MAKVTVDDGQWTINGLGLLELLVILARHGQPTNDMAQAYEDRLRDFKSFKKVEPKPATKKGPPIDFDWERGCWLNITPQDLRLWTEAYPAVNVERELKRLAAWVRANPKYRKKNWARFITNNLRRAQDRIGARAGPAMTPVDALDLMKGDT